MTISSKKRRHPQFSGVVRNVGGKKWASCKKVATRRPDGGGESLKISGAKKHRNILVQMFYFLCKEGQMEERNLWCKA